MSRVLVSVISVTQIFQLVGQRVQKLPTQKVVHPRLVTPQCTIRVLTQKINHTETGQDVTAVSKNIWHHWVQFSHTFLQLTFFPSPLCLGKLLFIVWFSLSLSLTCDLASKHDVYTFVAPHRTPQNEATFTILPHTPFKCLPIPCRHCKQLPSLPNARDPSQQSTTHLDQSLK